MTLNRIFPALPLALLAAGCTTAGPFVTSISSDGRGNLIVEKSMVQMNDFMGTVSNEGSTTTTIKLFDKEAIEELIREIQLRSNGQAEISAEALELAIAQLTPLSEDSLVAN